MPSTPATRGPVPKRSNVRAGHRGEADQPDRVLVRGPVRIPRASRAWHESARRWYRSLADSGQSRYFEPSDWSFARLLAELLSAELEGSPRATMVNAILAGMDRLGTTEAARRRMRIEVERTLAGDDDDSVVVFDQFRRLAGGD